MTRISKGFLDARWALLALTLTGCAATPEPAPDASSEEPRAEVVSEASPAPATVPESQVPMAETEPLVLKQESPAPYVVKKGDTLWGLSSHYLRDPWRWPELWQNNPHVRNPHLIYPGDRLTLIYVDGQPTLQVQRADEQVVTVTEAPPAAAAPEATAAPVTPAPLPLEVPRDRPYPTVKLSPQIRSQPLDKAIPTIPFDVISQFLTRPRIVTEEELDNAPYIFSSVDEHLVAGANNRVYVRNLKDGETTEYAVVRRGRAYVNPDDDEDVLGYEAIHVGDARLARVGDPATLDLIRTTREVLTGDLLLPADDGFVEQNFMPHAPPRFVDGSIMAVHDGVMQVGQYQIVVLNKGTDSGLDVGSVLAIYQASARVRDTVAQETVRLPRERAGTLLVFRTYERLSYALVMDATRPIHVNDAVTSP